MMFILMMSSGANCRYIIITAKLAALQPGVVLVIHVAFCFGGAFSGAAVSRGFNIVTVTAGSEPCNQSSYVSVWYPDMTVWFDGNLN